MKIFILHYSKLTERKQSILQQFAKHNITDFEFIEKYDKDSLTNENKILFEANFRPSMMSLMLKHFYVYKEIAEKYKRALILEDDVILSDDFSEKLNKYMTQLPSDFDMLFIGNGCNLHIEHHKIQPNQYIYPKCLHPISWGGMGASRCTDSYIISKQCAIKLCNYINNLPYKIKDPSDWWLNQSCRDNNFSVYWAEPTIVTQGTQNGTYSTSHSVIK
jgi:GR25 family glycosyltransferase involved in LPS biosynthesis